MEFLKSLNWVDILVAVVAIRIVYISVQTGFVCEFTKTLGVLAAVFVAFHYYVKISVIIGRMVQVPMSVVEVCVFTASWLLILLLCKFLRDGIFLVFTVQAISVVNQWGAAVVAIGRFFLTASMLMFVFLLTDQPYMERMTSTSFTQKYVLSVAPQVYRGLISEIVVKFFPNQKVNPAVEDEFFEAGKK
jgi:uncharacterized membrane protein required for colicin V production